ncbi:MAG: SRPBCC domain-containing protein [Saprospiraceae bacterium]|nr:SRPBCC domain-containing protein [Saprospiraceae bacterium]
MQHYDWTRFTKSIVVAADPQKIYSCFSTRGGMESWFLRNCVYNRMGVELGLQEEAMMGDHYAFMWHGWPDTTLERGEILKADGNKNFAFTFTGNEATSMEVHLLLEMYGRNTRVSLTQINIPDDENSRAKWHMGCLEGWTFYLTNLKSVIEGGLDLRNKNLDIKGVINA